MVPGIPFDPNGCLPLRYQHVTFAEVDPARSRSRARVEHESLHECDGGSDRVAFEGARALPSPRELGGTRDSDDSVSSETNPCAYAPRAVYNEEDHRDRDQGDRNPSAYHFTFT